MAIGTGWADGAWIDAGWVTGAWDAGATVPVVTPSTTGGKKKRRRYVVEIDGQFFDADNISAVEAALSTARELAQDAAQADVTTAIQVKPPRVKVLTSAGNRTTSVVINRAVRDTQKAINRIYRDAAKAIARQNEIADLMRRKLVEEDEEDALVALLLG